MVDPKATGMMLASIDLAGTLKPAEPPQTPRFWLDAEHSNRLQAASARNVMPVTDSIRTRSLDQTALSLGKCTCAVVLCDKSAMPCQTG